MVFRVGDQWHRYEKNSFFRDVIVKFEDYLEQYNVKPAKDVEIKVYGFVPELMPDKAILKVTYKSGSRALMADRVFTVGADAVKMDQVSVLDGEYPQNTGYLARSVLLFPNPEGKIGLLTEALNMGAIKKVDVDPRNSDMWPITTMLFHEKDVVNRLREQGFADAVNGVQLNPINETLAWKKWLYTFNR